MASTARLSRPAAAFLTLTVLLTGAGLAPAQLVGDGFVTGAAAAAWE